MGLERCAGAVSSPPRRRPPRAAATDETGAEPAVQPLTEQQIRASFANATRREAASAALPDLDALPWDRLDYLGWRDRRSPQSAYVVLELDGAPAGLLLRATAPDPTRVRRTTLCAWCQDVRSTDAVLLVARRAGAAGRAGNSVGTLVCEEFTCSQNVRRVPTASEVGTDDEDVRALFVAERVAGLRERSRRFVEGVVRGR